LASVTARIGKLNRAEKSLTLEETVTLARLYNNTPTWEIARLLKRKTHIIHSHAKANGLKRKNWMWTKFEDQELTKFYSVLPEKYVAMMLGRSVQAIQFRAKQKGIKRYEYPTEESISAKYTWKFIQRDIIGLDINLDVSRRFGKKSYLFFTRFRKDKNKMWRKIEHVEARKLLLQHKTRAFIPGSLQSALEQALP
jgi:hypothetical protein